VASYLRTRAELGQHQVVDIAAKARLSPEIVERTLAAQVLPAYPVLVLIGKAVDADTDYLLQAFLRAEAETASSQPTKDQGSEAARAAVTDVSSAFDSIVAGYSATVDEPQAAAVDEETHDPTADLARSQAPERVFLGECWNPHRLSSSCDG
jgi:hypothetical protein